MIDFGWFMLIFIWIQLNLVDISVTAVSKTGIGNKIVQETISNTGITIILWWSLLYIYIYLAFKRHDDQKWSNLKNVHFLSPVEDFDWGLIVPWGEDLWISVNLVTHLGSFPEAMATGSSPYLISRRPVVPLPAPNWIFPFRDSKKILYKSRNWNMLIFGHGTVLQYNIVVILVTAVMMQTMQ